MDHDAYLDGVTDPDVRDRLAAIRALVHEVVPDAEETIAYQMPAFRKGRIVFYFAAFKKHIGVYPPVTDPELLERLKPWRGPKDNLKFPHSKPLPLGLLREVAAALAEQYGR